MSISFVSALLLAGASCAAAATETNVFESATLPGADTPLDKLAFQQLARLHIQPVLCSDAVFVRRVYLDLLGTLPTAAEAKEFLQEPESRAKRSRLIEALLARPEFSDYWAMKWGDILRIKAEFPVNLWPNAAQSYHHWVKESLAHNKPYDKFVRELLTSSGSNFRVGPVNFYRAIQNRTPEGSARAVALTFMGARAEAWPSNRLSGMAVFFSQLGYKPTGEWKEKHVFWDPLGSSSLAGNNAPGRAALDDLANVANARVVSAPAARTNAPPTEALFPDGTSVHLGTDRDPREIFADWLIQPKNPWFTKNIVNRVWAWLLGRGIISEPDDIRDDNPPSDPALLAFLEQQFVASGYDLKQLYRLILNSQVYQLSSVPFMEAPGAEAACVIYKPRRLDAEVLSDALNKITGSSELYTSPIPEPFTYIPRGMPAVAIGDGSITSPFLALFGRSARATGLDSERDNKPTAAQWLYLLNSSDIQRKLEQGTNLQAIIGFGRKPSAQVARELYLTILSRFPTEAELKVLQAYGRNQSISLGTRPGRRRLDGALQTNAPAATPANTEVTVKRREDWLDVAWALLNSEEFLYRH